MTQPAFVGSQATIDDSDSAIQGDTTAENYGMHEDTDDSPWSAIIGEPEPPPTIVGEDSYDKPDPGLLNQPARSRTAKEYEKKVAGILQFLWRATCERPSTVADSATILMHGPDVAIASGDWAENSERVRKIIDWATEGADNDLAKFVLAFAPMALQFVRNHEEPLAHVAGIKIPFTKRYIKLPKRFRIGLGPARNQTNDPDALVRHVYSDPDIQAGIKKLGIKVAANGYASASYN